MTSSSIRPIFLTKPPFLWEIPGFYAQDLAQLRNPTMTIGSCFFDKSQPPGSASPGWHLVPPHARLLSNTHCFALLPWGFGFAVSPLARGVEGHWSWKMARRWVKYRMERNQLNDQLNIRIGSTHSTHDASGKWCLEINKKITTLPQN